MGCMVTLGGGMAEGGMWRAEAEAEPCLRPRQLRPMRPYFFERPNVLREHFARFAIEQRQEDMVGIHVSVAGHGLGNLRAMMPPLRLGIDLQFVLLGVIPEPGVDAFGLQRLH